MYIHLFQQPLLLQLVLLVKWHETTHINKDDYYETLKRTAKKEATD